LYLLDTNVLSETGKPRPDRKVLDWLERLQPGEAATSATVVSELFFGAFRHPDAVRRRVLTSIIELSLQGVLGGRVLPFDEAAARVHADLLVTTRHRTRPKSDLQIAAVAMTNRLILVTRNTRDFEGVGLQLLNPWDS
jgi:toxin FitB